MYWVHKIGLIRPGASLGLEVADLRAAHVPWFLLSGALGALTNLVTAAVIKATSAVSLKAPRESGPCCGRGVIHLGYPKTEREAFLCSPRVALTPTR